MGCGEEGFVARGAKRPTGVSRGAGSVWRVPADAEALHAWLREQLRVDVPREAVAEGSVAPFDYLVHTFFEGRGSMSGLAERGRRRSPVDSVVWACRGGGKTFLGAVATLLDMVFKPGIEVRVLGGSMDQSKRLHAHLRRLLDARVNAELAGMVEGNILSERVRFKNGSAVELLSQSQASVRGTRVQKLRCDEVDLFKEDVWEAAQLTTMGKRCGEFEVRGSIDCLSTMHVPHGVMHEVVGEAKAGRRALFRWGVMDVVGACGEEYSCGGGPGGVRCGLWGECGGRAKGFGEGRGGHLPVADVLAMKGRVALSTWKSEMLCERPTRKDAVLPEFERARHVVEALPFGAGAEGLTWVAGMDFGWRSPTVVVWGAVDEEGVLWIVAERSVSMETMDRHIEAVVRGLPEEGRERGWPGCSWIGVDPAGMNRHEQTGMSNVGMMRAAGLVVKARRLGLHEGLGLLRARLAPADGGPPRLRVHARCEKLIESLERYHYPRDDGESDQPWKGDGFDHAVDALRYVVQNLDKPYRAGALGY